MRPTQAKNWCAVAISISLLSTAAACGAGGTAAKDDRAASLADALSAATSATALPGQARELWSWSTKQLDGGVIALAPAPNGGMVALASTPLPTSAPAATVPTYLGWFSANGELIGARSLASGAPSSVRLATPALLVTPDGWAVLAFNVTCDPGSCPDVGAGPMSTGAHVVRFSATGEVRHVPLANGDVESIAVNARGEVYAALSTTEGAVIRFVPADLSAPQLPHEIPVGGTGPIRLAFLGNGSLVIGQGSTITRVSATGAVLWRLDAGAPWEILDVAATGDLIAIGARHPTASWATVELDAAGAVRWATRIIGGDVAIHPSGAVAVTNGDAVLFDGNGAFQWAWANVFPVYPPPFAAAAVTFHGDSVIAGGWKNGRVPFISVLGQ